MIAASDKSPVDWVGRIGLGMLLVLSSLLVLSVKASGDMLAAAEMHRFPLLTSGCFAGFIFGTLTVFWAELRLQDGLRSEIWSRAELVGLRRLVNHRVVVGLLFVPMLCWLAFLCDARLWHSAYFVWYLGELPYLLLPLGMLQRVRHSLPHARMTELREWPAQ